VRALRIGDRAGLVDNLGEEFCLGTFELRTGSNYSDGEK
jgi:hypothetical protein